MKVRCINKIKNNQPLTLMQEYEVAKIIDLDGFNKGYVIVDDNGNSNNWYHDSFFEVIKDTETPTNPTHYHTKIQPIEFIEANNLGFHEGNVVKYITRYKDKNGIEDLEKAKTYIEMLIEKLKRENV